MIPWSAWRPSGTIDGAHSKSPRSPATHSSAGSLAGEGETALVTSASESPPICQSACLVLLLAAMVASLSPHAVAARTWHVPADQPTIQAGILAASTGDTVLVASGLHRGQGNRDIRFDRALVLKSEGGPERTIIDCEGTDGDNHRGFLCIYGSTGGSIDGFTITGGYVGDGGAAVRFDYGSPSLRNCVLRGNEGGTQGGAIYIFMHDHPSIEHCTITGNTADTGAGILCLAYSTPTITDCLITDNHARQQTGGITGAGALPTFARCVIAGNEGWTSGGIESKNGSLMTLNDCLIYGNRGHWNAGAAAMRYSGSIAFTGCTITSNYSDHRGGGLYFYEGGSATLSRTILWGDCGDWGGNEVYFEYASGMSATLECCDVDSAGIDGEGAVIWAADNIFGDPQLCGPEPCQNAPTDGGDYKLESSSPCLPNASLCAELIGARGEGCIPPPIGACCFSDGSCVVTGQQQCEGQHGIYRGNGTTCDPNPCQPTPVKPTTWGRIKSSFR